MTYWICAKDRLSVLPYFTFLIVLADMKLSLKNFYLLFYENLLTNRAKYV